MFRSESTRTGLCFVCFAASWALVAAVTLDRPAQAAILTTGDLSPGYPGDQPDPWNVGGTLSVGDTSAGEMTIDAGSDVSNTDGFIGVVSGSTGVVTVTGPGSTWTNSGYVAVGDSGTGTVNIESGGTVNVMGQLDIGRFGVGLINVDGGTSTIMGFFHVGGSNSVGTGGVGTLSIVNGGNVTSLINCDIGRAVDSTGMAQVSGPGSTWNTGSLTVGELGDGILEITDGAHVQSNAAASDFGTAAGSTGTATVTGAGSIWTNTGQLQIGREGKGTLMIEAGGSVSNTIGFIGLLSGSTGVVTVTGPGSIWTNTGQLQIGTNASGTLRISNGAQVSNTLGFIGVSAGSTGTATVTGAGSTWTSSGSLSVGYDRAGTLMIEAGGSVSNTSGFLGRNAGSTGTATVSGAGSIWTNSGTLQIGSSGTGTLLITSGGRVSNPTGYIGLFSGSTGVVTVIGPGSRWQNTGSLYVGGSPTQTGGQGTLSVSDGGVVSVGNALQLWSTGTLGGDGTIEGDVVNGGLASPGNSAGTLSVMGDYTQQAAGTLQIEIGGVLPGQWDVLAAGGNASLAGTIQVLLRDDFEPLLGNSFTIITTDAGNVGGQFDTQLFPVFNDLTFDVVYNSKSVALHVIDAGGLPGDYNDNDIVDAADYTVWRDRLGSDTALANDDTPGVGPDDYDRWKLHFGEVPGGNGSGSGAADPAPGRTVSRVPASAESLSAAVPEPATWLLIGLAAASLAVPRRGRTLGRHETVSRTFFGLTAKGFRTTFPAPIWEKRCVNATRFAALLVAAFLSSAPVGAVVIDTVPIGNPGNLADTTGFGSVGYNYRIGTYEVTNAQYVEFLNSVDPTGANTLFLYSPTMASNGSGGIVFNSGAANGSKFEIKPGRDSNPVNFVSWFDSLRFANWLHNGQGNGATEVGAYTLLGGTPSPSNGSSITRNEGAQWWLPSEDEWYKAAYHKNDGVTGNYWLYPTSTNAVPHSDQPPGSDAPDPSNTANFFADDGIANGYDDGYAATGSTASVESQNYLTDVGAYTLSTNPYGTFDQGGNLWEWTELIVIPAIRGGRGGSAWSSVSDDLQASDMSNGIGRAGGFNVGIRVASISAVLPVLTINPGSTLNLDSETIDANVNNAGQINVTGPATITGYLNNAAGAETLIDSAQLCCSMTFEVAGPITNSGTFTMRTDSASPQLILDARGGFANSGTFNMASATEGEMFVLLPVGVSFVNNAAGIINLTGPDDLNGDGMIETMHTIDGNVVNNGAMNIRTNTQIAGSLANAVDANVMIDSATLCCGMTFEVAGPISNSGTFTMRTDSASPQLILDARGGFANSGTFTMMTDSASPQLAVELAAGETFTNDATGVLQGAGTIDGNVLNRGAVRPGNSTGVLTITGDFSQESDGKLVVEVAGTTAGSGYDQLAIGGDITLDGLVEVIFDEGFVPQIGNRFEIITTAEPVSSKFAGASLPGLPEGMDWGIHYGASAVSLAIGVPGDYNGNGTVDAADFTVWRDTLGQTGVFLAADGNGNDEIDAGDYDFWKAHFGEVAGGNGPGSGASLPSAGPLSAAAPEPATLVLLILAAAAWCFRRSGPRRESQHLNSA